MRDSIDEFSKQGHEAPEEVESVNHLREFAIERMDEFWIRALHLLYSYDGNKNMALDCFMFMIGEGPNIGLKSATAIARKHLVTKSNVTKCIILFQDSLNIEAMPGQRDDQGRLHMALARKEQLK